MRLWRRVVVPPLLLLAACRAPVGPARTTAPPPTIEQASCDAERGADAARILANRCRLVSPATRPPCHPANSCALIEAEIARSCTEIGVDAPECAGPTPRSREGALHDDPITSP